jgi:hypothetical protein
MSDRNLLGLSMLDLVMSSGANYVKHCDVRKVLTAVTCLVLMAEQADIDVGNVIIH